MTGKVAVLGSSDFVMPFAAMGLDTFAVEPQREEVEDTAGVITAGQYALVVVAENIAPLAQAAFSAQQNNPVPCVIVVPFTTEPQGFAIAELGKALKLATGIDILQNNL